jgi:tRNA pseudouridine13 synthase
MTALARLAPHEPRLITAELLPVGGAIGPDPEDFVVDELLRTEPSGAGEHLWVRVRKRLLSTPVAVRAVAKAAAVRERDVGYAGLKDKYAVTSQWLSLPAHCRPTSGWQLPPGLTVLEQRRHTHKLRTGQHRGNRFKVRLVGVAGDARGRAEPICARLREGGLPNYFGAQRFGARGENLSQAVAWLNEGAPRLGRQTRLLRKLLPSVIQAEAFNRCLTARLRLGLARLLPGDVVRLAGSRSLFEVTDPEAELARLRSGDIHLTGPIIGPKMKQPTGQARQVEEEALTEIGLPAPSLELLGQLADGTRRDLVVNPEGLQVAADDADLRMEFCLPAGSYATQLLRELTHADWLSSR